MAFESNDEENIENQMSEIEKIEQKINDTKPKSEKEIKDKKPKKEPEKIEDKEETKKEEQKKIEEQKATKEEPAEMVQEKLKKDKKNVPSVLAILTILITILIFSTIFALLNLGNTTIAKGVSVKGIDVSNLTIQEATNKINEAIQTELMLGMNLVYNEEYKVDFEPSQIEYSYDVNKAIKEAYNVGKGGNIVINNYELLYIAFAGKNIEVENAYNEELLDSIVNDVAAKVPGLVVQPSYYIEDDELIIDKGKAGIEVEKEALKAEILENIASRNSQEIQQNSQKEIVKIGVKNVEPEAVDVEKIYNEVFCEPQDAYYIPEPFQIFAEKDGIDFAVTLQEAENIMAADKKEYIIPLKLTPAAKTINDIGTEAFPYLISSFSTKYDASNRNRSGNLKLAADKINGTVLMPGEEFSFNEVVGKRTIEAGYTNAKIYENGQVVDGLAGGICQISSTLYNAVLLANLDVTVRRNHSYTTTYVRAGRDATVVYGTQDFKFKNTRTYPVKIEASVGNGIAEFKIHGIKEETEYEIKIIPVTTQTIPYGTEHIPDPALAPGQQVVKQAGHAGYRVTTYIEKRLGGALVSKEVLSKDTYNPMKTIIHVGP